MSLEEIIHGSRDIRNFLKLFSEQNCNKVIKATLLIGMYRLTEISERCGKSVANLSLSAIEELAVVAHQKSRQQRKRMARNSKKNEFDTSQKQSTFAGASEIAPRGVISHESSFLLTSPEHNSGKKHRKPVSAEKKMIRKPSSAEK